MSKNPMTIRDLITQLLQLDMDTPVLIHNPKDATREDVEDGSDDRGVVIEADDTAPAIYVTETSNGVVISEMKPAD